MWIYILRISRGKKKDGRKDNRLKYSNILDKLGYLPVSSKAARILHSAARKPIGMFGQSASNAIIDHMCSINGLSKDELLTNCDLLDYTRY